MRTSQETSQTVTPRDCPKEATDLWSEGATKVYKIWHDGFVQVDPMVLG